MWKKIKELLGYALSVRKISNVLEYTNHIALNTFIKKRNIKNKKKVRQYIIFIIQLLAVVAKL